MRFVTMKNNKITSVRFGTKAVGGEVQKDQGDLGQLLQSEGTFIDDPRDLEIETERNRIIELKKAITDKKLLDIDCTQEQNELKILLGL